MNSAIILFIFATSSAWTQVIPDPFCGKEQWKCRDDTCISIDDICDGVRSCPDGSDETFALCRNVQCQANWFRCAYGACADGPAPCDNVQDCADNSDELLRRCRNETEEVRGIFKCINGQEIAAYFHCDGTRDCTDGSDEILKECAGKTCASDMFQCAYGACVEPGSDCDYKENCADGSDESEELCNRLEPITSVTTSNVSQSSGPCMLPPYPLNGHYTLSNVHGAVPGQGLFAVALNISCNPGYTLTGAKGRLCVAGLWQPSKVTNNECVRDASFCRLHKDPSVRFRCLIPGKSENLTECNEYVPNDTLVSPACNTPNYFYKGFLPYMRCINGQWDYVARCQAECGRVVPGIYLGVNVRPAGMGEVPWHAGIYQKTTDANRRFMQICSGSLVSSKVVISAAHCFWNNVMSFKPAYNYAVALGKLHRPWDYKGDTDVQRSDVEDIKTTLYTEKGLRAHNFQHDIAILLLVTVIEFKPHIRPVCIDFSVAFENRQLSPGNKGKAGGWYQTGVLNVLELPYITIKECFDEAPGGIKQLITPDKFCAGFKNGTAICVGDSGGGLAFPDVVEGTLRYYLRGIISVAPIIGENTKRCASWLMLFTMISSHEKFILQNM